MKIWEIDTAKTFEKYKDDNDRCWLVDATGKIIDEHALDITDHYDSHDLLSINLELIEKQKSFTQDDLKTGMIVKERSGCLLMYIRTEFGGEFVNKDFSWASSIEDYCEFESKLTCEDDDIVEVFACNRGSNLEKKNWGTTETLWKEEQEELVRMTVREIENKLGIKNLVIAGYEL